MLTSNKGFEEWGAVLGDEVMAAALIRSPSSLCIAGSTPVATLPASSRQCAANINGTSRPKLGLHSQKVGNSKLTKVSNSKLTLTSSALLFRVKGYANPTNTAPTSADGTVTMDEDTTYTFSANDFSFFDTDNTDTNDTLSSVTIATLPGNGSLTLLGAPVSVDDSVTAAQLGSGALRYAPPAHAFGVDCVSFNYNVSDGTAESAENILKRNVAPVCDPPAGAPTIVGEAIVGATLTLDISGLVYTDGFGEKENAAIQSWPASCTIAPELILSVAPTTIYLDNRTATVTIATDGGATLDTAKTINLTVSASITGFDHDTLTVQPAATTGILAPADVTLTIRDDDEAPDTVSLSVDVASVAEDGCVSRMTATVSPAAPEAFTVTLSAASRRRV